MNFTWLAAGTYPVTIQDANGCTDVLSVTLTEPAQFSINFTIDNSIS